MSSPSPSARDSRLKSTGGKKYFRHLKASSTVLVLVKIIKMIHTVRRKYYRISLGNGALRVPLYVSEDTHP